MQVAGDIDDLVACHHRLTGPRRDPATLPAGQHVITASHTERQTTLLVRTGTAVHDPSWTVTPHGGDQHERYGLRRVATACGHVPWSTALAAGLRRPARPTA